MYRSESGLYEEAVPQVASWLVTDRRRYSLYCNKDIDRPQYIVLDGSHDIISRFAHLDTARHCILQFWFRQAMKRAASRDKVTHSPVSLGPRLTATPAENMYIAFRSLKNE